VKVAIVGCGWAGVRHAQAYRAAGAELAWAVDVDLDRAQALGAARATVDLATALADPEVDAVSICLPHALHAQASVEAATSEKHVLVEKPIAASLAEADRMIAAADSAHVVLMVAESVRFDPLLERAVHLVQAGTIGPPALVQVTRQAYLRESFLSARRWFLDRDLAAGGIMMSGGIHDFDILRMLLGEPLRVYAVRVRQRFAEMQGDDTSVAIVSFPNQVTATLTESFLMKTLVTASGPEEHTVRVDGDLGSLIVDAHRQTIHLFSELPHYQRPGAVSAREIRVPPDDPFEREVRHFLACIESGAEPITSGRTQRRNLELVLAAYGSMASGAPVAV
jgi:predicted dehydrogenase